MPIRAVCTLESLSPLSFSKHYEIEKLQKEAADEYEERTWREKAHYDSELRIFIPPMAPKLCLENSARRMGIKIPGRRGMTYTQCFVSGVLVLDGVPLGMLRDEMPSERLFLPSDGKRGGGKRVWKRFPLVPQWRGDVTFHILDATITEEVFVDVLREAGNFVGLHRFRPQNGGYYGRFRVPEYLWLKD